jgi:hypothetical protein
MSFGEWRGLGHWEVDGRAHFYMGCFDKCPRFHYPTSSVLKEQFAASTEEDGIVFSHFALFDPIATAIETFFPHLHVRTFSEMTVAGTLEGSKMDSRMDILLKATTARADLTTNSTNSR